ncbi:ABC transporter ATP-binding protein [Pseudomonas matsuisoli]|uniref:Iron ABC transporter substrate-binding protein n=1 Tax=Pseudomonas matsuisoli TaxID=1515666 RepID=A0A917UVS2_9PSED|nr:ABC transporter ATP-binding protein [Pseudomonas matsuisoli]GGJ88974.1 iron ABC transporter substrate-binding protein [Pseudomonas matsuisoli]
MTGTAIRLRQCAKTFQGGQTALSPIDLDVRPGETLVFLGPSGCGKTTTLRLIAGLETPDAGGRILFGDDDVTDVPIEKRGVGMVFQSYALFSNLDVAGNVAYGLKVRGMPKAERATRVAEMLELMHLQDFADRSIHALSGGQRQRVALARALAARPRILLLDEPLAALDAQLREQLRVDIDRLLRTLHITAIYVTHDQAEAMALGDRIVVMENGRIAQIGTPQDIYQRPANAFVAGFIGNLNRFDVLAHEQGRARVAGGWLPWNDTSATVLCCRPEHLEIVHANGALQGQVLGQFFQGAHTRVLVDIGNGRQLLVDSRDDRLRQRGDLIEMNVTGPLFALAA